MKDVLVYVDAENISVDKFREVNEQLNTEQDTWVHGKVYGSRSVLGDILTECIEAGYTYTDTSVCVDTTKNVTDIQIVCDCITDITTAPRGKYSAVYILSSDHDFVPLIRKLKAQKVEVITPFLDVNFKRLGVADLNNYLTEQGFDPIAQKDLLANPLELFRSVVPEQFTDDLLQTYVMQKKHRFARELASAGAEECASHVDQVDPADFSFQYVVQLLHLRSISQQLKMLNIYTQKMFGISLKREEALRQLKAMQEVIS